MKKIIWEIYKKTFYHLTMPATRRVKIAYEHRATTGKRRFFRVRCPIMTNDRRQCKNYVLAVDQACRIHIKKCKNERKECFAKNKDAKGNPIYVKVT